MRKTILHTATIILTFLFIYYMKNFLLHKYNNEQVISSSNMYGKLESMGKEPDVACFEVLYQHLPRTLQSSSEKVTHVSAFGLC
jgi:hypothetical protein